MIRKVLLIVFTCFKCIHLSSQGYEVEKCLFNTPLDEINPFVLDGNLYFASNNNHRIDKDYSVKKRNVKRAYYRIFAEDRDLDSSIIDAYEYKGKNNISSFEFHQKSETGYFTVSVKKKNNYSRKSSSSIFISHFVDGAWGDLIPFEHNVDFYNMANACFSADGKRMYFESDMLNGFGGYDIWYCDWSDDKWSIPINAGNKINSSSNEKTPCLDSENKLYFSSDRRKEISGYDIYAYYQDGTTKRLPFPINSNKDDMGYVKMDSLFEGYFSSNRDGIGYDIFKYSRPLPENPHLLESYKAQECFTFSDPEPFEDSRNLIYVWDFGDGKTGINNNARHCYDYPGKYTVSLMLEDELDSTRRETVGSKTLEVHKSSVYYLIKSEDSLETFQVSGEDLRNTKDIGEIVWEMGSRLYYDQTEFSLDKELCYGQYALNAYFKVDTVNYLLTDTIINVPENVLGKTGQKYRLVCENNRGKINNQGIEFLNEVTSSYDSGSGKAVLLIRDEISQEAYDLLVKQMSNFGLSFATKVDKRISSPFIEICYD